MKTTTHILTVAIVVLLFGCATEYQSKSLTGGYSHTQLAPDVFRVVFRGNGYTAPERAQDFALLRASELFIEQGCAFIAVLEESNTTKTSSFTSLGTAQTSGSVQVHGNAATYSGYTIYTPGQTSTAYKPRTGLLVQGIKTKPEGVFTYEAAFLQQSIRQKYGIK